MKKRGIHFISATQNIYTISASGRLQMQIMGAFAEFERNIISERTKETLKKAVDLYPKPESKEHLQELFNEYSLLRP